ncbi:MAG: UDP-N-acetylpyruvoylglucosamine reductase [Candidatus Saccharibacteria bacterium GW2011_GWC2_48_9]|nr:MAG: UDP-N-acetylpyruvoylglucosamine reductase [Candidatus Saccharibacteria bacterium GW2011_GWC2_48_9]HCH34898.1 UDP-N-acetylmuramate dehydrogenase [Candidatus Saccharibacteria bacterium]
MNVHTNIPLKNYLSMKIGGTTRFMTDVSNIDELHQVMTNAKTQNLPFFILGSGSNVIARDDEYPGLVVRVRIPGFEVVAEDHSTTTIKIGAGEIWDEVVARSVDMNLVGIEAMSDIPSYCGAAPVQNIGAYGQELADTLVSLEAYDTSVGQIVSLSNDDCKFTYRDSIFRVEEQGRYIITSITLQLYKSAPTPPFYQALQNYFDEHGITIFTPKVIREAVSEIRREKLPDPAKRPNSGSFFKNAIIDQWQLDELLREYSDMPHYEMGEGRYKIPSGWLIEQCGFKGQLLHGMRVNPANALVLINESASGYLDLSLARAEITQTVQDRFRISIEQEPLEIA